MNKTLLAAIIAMATGLVAVAPAHATEMTDAQKQAATEKWQNMTPDERAAAKAKAKARYDAMTPEQQAAAKKKFAENHPEAAAKMAAKQAASAPTK